ncbi:hypothetical protein AB1K54_13330 [Microbacterium sp. BWT-B31]|uniref:hypothetical protein n=1 Tax=Microbacterium sp. BWT-B31 TaxID=3232072 RepID=UPI0035289A94
MTALPLSPESERELAALRRRAYGPGADIHDDADALARLQALESLTRPAPRDAVATPARTEPAAVPEPAAAPEPAPALASAPAAESAPAHTPAPHQDEASATADGSPDEQPARADVPASPGPWGRVRRAWSATPRWILAIGCLVVGVAAGIGAVNLTAPQPTARLPVAAIPPGQEPPAHFVADALTWHGLENSDLRPHEPYRGMSIYSARNNRGEDCLFVAVSSDWPVGGCAPASLGPVVDVPYGAVNGAVRDPDFGFGDFLRLTLDGAVVEVWFHEGTDAAAEASES